MSYAVRNDGLGWRAVDGPDGVGPDEHFSEAQPDPVPIPPPDPRDQIAKETEIALRSGLGYELVELAMRSYMDWVHQQPGGAEITEAQILDPMSPYYSVGYAKNKATRDTLLALVQSK